MRIRTLLLIGASVAIAKAVMGEPHSPLPTVPHVDLDRYVGKWYEIAKYPVRFEKECAGDVTATYTSQPDGKIEVLNACRKADGQIKSSKGSAKVVDKATNAKLKVTFFWPFSGNYWILDLAPDYSYAVVGEPSRKYLWVLSRTPQMEEPTFRRIMAKLTELGYEPSRLEKTLQHQAELAPAMR